LIVEHVTRVAKAADMKAGIIKFLTLEGKSS
jgi:hypothetical protein